MSDIFHHRVATTATLEIKKLELLVSCGILPEEKERRQPFSFDLAITFDATPAIVSDDLSDTLDYSNLVQIIQDIVAHRHYELFENLAGTIGNKLMEDNRIETVSVTVTKLRPPVAVSLATAGICLHFQRR